ncbi:PcfJ domain-containing protein [Clostridium perfringens]
MNKRELRRIEILNLDENIYEENSKQLRFDIGQFEFNIVPQVHDDILVLNIFKNEDIKKGILIPTKRIFQSKDDYITQDLRENKWLTGAFYNMLGLYGYYNRCYTKRYIFINDRNKNIINSYIANSGIKTEEDPLTNIERLQMKIQAYRLSLKHKKITDRIDKEMECVEELPEDFEEWIDKEAFKFSQYIYYEYRPKKKLKGYCTHCKSDVEIESSKHNKEGICPNCKCRIRYKVLGKSKNVHDETYLSLMQKTDEGVLIRYFRSKKSYFEHFKNPTFQYWELLRVFINKDNIKKYEYADFKQTGKTRWCDSIGRFNIYESSLYFNNLGFLKDTEYKYSAIELLAKEKVFNVFGYLTKYKTEKFLEYLVKLKLYNLAADYSSIFYDVGINPEGNNIKEILGVDKVNLKRLQELNANISTYKIIKAFYEDKIKLTNEELKIIIEKGIYWQQLLFILKEINKTPSKLIKYIDKLHGEFDDRLGDYADYINNAVKLKYDLTKDMVIFPRNFNEAHDIAADLIIKLEQNKNYVGFMEHYKNLGEEYNYESEKYIIVKPQKPIDLIKEGQALNHCVGSYIKSVANNKTTILFVREKDNIEKPFYTLEIKKDRLIQCRTKRNESYKENKEVKEFVDKYIKNIKSSILKIAV